jgi:hypothetical protein
MNGVDVYAGSRNEGARMGKIQDIYDTRVRPMTPVERLQLAKLILDDLARSEYAVDISDEWNEDDRAEVAAYSARQADRSAEDSRSRP